MKLAEFAAMVPGFDALAPRDMICHLAWYLHVRGGKETFVTQDIGQCYKELDLVAPNVSQYLGRLSQEKPPTILRNKSGFRLARLIRIELDKKYALNPTTIAVSKILTDLMAQVPNLAERAFLQEALKCYTVEAFRSAIVMAWNLAYDHLMRWILADPKRLNAFNSALAKRFPKKGQFSKSEDFEDIKEFDMVELCGTAGLLGSNTVKILKEKLTRRNIAAHPSNVVVTEHQTNDVITDLVNNVVLVLK